MIKEIEIVSREKDACTIKFDLKDFMKTNNVKSIDIQLKGTEVDECVDMEDIWALRDAMEELFEKNNISSELERAVFICKVFLPIFDAIMFETQADATIIIYDEKEEYKGFDIQEFDRRDIEDAVKKAVSKLIMSQLGKGINK